MVGKANLNLNIHHTPQNLNKAKSMEDFFVIKELGSGHYGSVFLVQEKQSGFICAIKQIKKALLI